MRPGDRFVMFMIVHVTCQPQAKGHWICYIRSQCLLPPFGCVEFCFFLLGPSKKRCPGKKKLANQWVPHRISSTGSVNGTVLTFFGCCQTCYGFRQRIVFCRKLSGFSIWVLRPKREVVPMTWLSLLASSGMLWSLSCLGYLHNRICFRCHFFRWHGDSCGKGFGFWWKPPMACRVILFSFVMFWCLQTFNMGKASKHLELVWSWMAATTVDIFWIKASQLIPLALYSGWHVLYTKGFGRFGQGQSSTPEGVFPGWASTDERRRFGGVVASDLWWAGAKRCHWNRSRTLWRIQFSTSLWKAAGQAAAFQ